MRIVGLHTTSPDGFRVMWMLSFGLHVRSERLDELSLDSLEAYFLPPHDSGRQPRVALTSANCFVYDLPPVDGRLRLGLTVFNDDTERVALFPRGVSLRTEHTSYGVDFEYPKPRPDGWIILNPLEAAMGNVQLLEGRKRPRSVQLQVGGEALFPEKSLSAWLPLKVLPKPPVLKALAEKHSAQEAVK